MECRREQWRLGRQRDHDGICSSFSAWLESPSAPRTHGGGNPGYRRMAERYGSESFQALEMLIAVDSLLASLLDEMSTRELNQQVTLVVTADAAVIESDAERPLPSWWAEGENYLRFRSIKGQLYVDALAMEREVDDGFVTLRITDADLPGEALNRVRFTLYNGAGEEQAQHFPNADGSLGLPVPVTVRLTVSPVWRASQIW